MTDANDTASRRRLPLAWSLVALGLLIDAFVLVTPFTPYPVLRMLLDRDALAFERGYAQLLEKGIWTKGDPGFELIQRRYMEDVAAGLVFGLEPSELIGQTIGAFELSEPVSAVTSAQDVRVFVVYSNLKATVRVLSQIRLLQTAFHSPAAANTSALLLIAGTAFIYSGLTRILALSEDYSDLNPPLSEPARS